MHLHDSVHLYKCGQVHLDMPEIIPNNKSAICQDLIELMMLIFLNIIINELVWLITNSAKYKVLND